MKYIATIVLLIMLMPACVTYDKCVAKYGITGDTTYIPFEVVIHKDSIITHIQIDSIPFLVHGDTHYIENPDTRAKIKYWYDMYIKAISIQAECDSIIIRDTIPCPPSPVLLNEKEIYKQCYLKLFAYAFVIILIVGILYALIYPLILKK